ncbi:MAG: class I SAM-dependent methyltransferase [Nocardioidaceae bacterium]
MTQTAATDLKVKHRQMWASGDYPRLAAEVIPNMGQTLVDACGLGPGDRVLDVAAGSGNAAIPAALAGADVVASDLTPELLDAGKALAEARGATLAWETADAEALPYAEGEFDAVVSCVGVMFAPHHQESADELARVLRTGGKLGLASWTPEGYIGQLFATMRPFAPPPPPGAQPPPLWGDEDHVRALLGDRITDVDAHRQTLTVDCFSTPTAFREFFKTYYGPTIAVYRSLAEQPDRAAELDAVLDDLASSHGVESGRMEWEYLLLVARRA